jgi:hypothetical protein
LASLLGITAELLNFVAGTLTLELFLDSCCTVAQQLLWLCWCGLLLYTVLAMPFHAQPAVVGYTAKHPSQQQ